MRLELKSSIVPTLDALLNVEHERDELREYLDEMKSYMPPSHRELIKFVEDTSKVKEQVSSNKMLMELLMIAARKSQYSDHSI